MWQQGVLQIPKHRDNITKSMPQPSHINCKQNHAAGNMNMLGTASRMGELINPVDLKRLMRARNGKWQNRQKNRQKYKIKTAKRNHSRAKAFGQVHFDVWLRGTSDTSEHYFQSTRDTWWLKWCTVHPNLHPKISLYFKGVNIHSVFEYQTDPGIKNAKKKGGGGIK